MLLETLNLRRVGSRHGSGRKAWCVALEGLRNAPQLSLMKCRVTVFRISQTLFIEHAYYTSRSENYELPGTPE